MVKEIIVSKSTWTQKLTNECLVPMTFNLAGKSSVITFFLAYGHLYFQPAHFIPIVGEGKRGAYSLVHGDLPRQHPFGTTLRCTGHACAGGLLALNAIATQLRDPINS